ncbi:MAG: glycosyl transferase [Clostridia bacterium]|nr:glycosyl transferase [Clostridia bacterium]
MNIFCTLFDSNYLDKGLALYRSMERVMDDFKLYILAMDDLCQTILEKKALSNVVVVSREDFEDDELKKIKAERSRAEYCWTCTASLLDYIFETYHEEYCTYIDSDLYFYMSPQMLLEEMKDAGCSVQIVEHRFGKGRRAKQQEESSGKYCVQFNTFKNDAKGRQVLKIWKNQCRERCSMDDGAMGDQKYLVTWTSEYDCVHELQNHGGGVAPWNVGRYRLMNEKNGQIRIWCRDTKQVYPLVFYHFHNLEYFDEDTVNINVYRRHLRVDEMLVQKTYYPYLREIEEIKDELKEHYGFRPLVQKHPGLAGKSKKSWLQKLRGKRLSELYDAVVDNVIRAMGRKKDIISIKEL